MGYKKISCLLDLQNVTQGTMGPRPVQLAPPGQPQPGGMMPAFMQQPPVDPRQPQPAVPAGLGPVEQQGEEL